jgi:hypothetical protein
MATQILNLVCDSSTLTNFKAWAQPISTAFSTFGWLQSADTGQVNWSSIAAVPGSGAYVYEVWQPNDGLANFFLKVEYGNFSGATNCPSLRITVGTSTNGAGTINSGIIMGPFTTVNQAFTPSSTTTQYECDFSGAPGRFGVMLWRTGINWSPQFFAIERSVNSSGAYTSSYVTVYIVGYNASNILCFHRSLVFGVGVAPPSSAVYPTGGNSGQGGWNVRVSIPGTGTSTNAFQNSIPFDTCAPNVGYLDFPGTIAGSAYGPDIVDGVTFQVTLYGSTRTYMPGKQWTYGFAGPASGSLTQWYALCMRFD